jgi:hypothetical protein
LPLDRKHPRCLLDLSVQFFFSAIEAATACDLIEPFSKNKNGRLCGSLATAAPP